MEVLVGFSGYTPIFAHFGHWYVSLPVFSAPVLIIAVAVKVSERRERHRVRSGETSRMGVSAVEQGGETVLRVRGRLDYPTLLDIEHELERLTPTTKRVLLVLSDLTAVEDERFAWDLAETIKRVEGAEVRISIGEAPALEELRKVSALEGLALVTGDSVLG